VTGDAAAQGALIAPRTKLYEYLRWSLMSQEYLQEQLIELQSQFAFKKTC